MAFHRKKSADIPGRRQTSGVERIPREADKGQYVFQRNRTLTGSTSNRISQAHHDTADLKSPRSEAHQLASQRRKIGGILLAVCTAIVIVAALLFQFTARVGVTVSDTTISTSIEDARYEDVINEYLGIYPIERLRFVLNMSELDAYMKARLPEVSKVNNVSFGSFIGETDISLTMRRPVAGWNIDNEQYYVDAKGIAFRQNYYTAPTVNIIDQTGVELAPGTTVASNRFLGFVGRVVALSNEQGYKVTEAILPLGTTRQLEVRLEGTVPRVRLSIDRAVGEQVEDMARALRYLATAGRTPEYVDVRVSGKAFYK